MNAKVTYELRRELDPWDKARQEQMKKASDTRTTAMMAPFTFKVTNRG